MATASVVNLIDSTSVILRVLLLLLSWIQKTLEGYALCMMTTALTVKQPEPYSTPMAGQNVITATKTYGKTSATLAQDKGTVCILSICGCSVAGWTWINPSVGVWNRMVAGYGNGPGAALAAFLLSWTPSTWTSTIWLNSKSSGGNKYLSPSKHVVKMWSSV